jgi:hypothetical protein
MPSFSQKLACALDSVEVQAKVHDVILKPIYEKSMAEFGKCMGIKVGGMFAEFKEDIEGKLKELRHTFDNDIAETTTLIAAPQEVRMWSASELEQYEGAIAVVEPAARASYSRQGTHRTRTRRDRRKRIKSKSLYLRGELLQLRPRGDIVVVAPVPPPGLEDSCPRDVDLMQTVQGLQQQVATIQASLAGDYSCAAASEWEPFQGVASPSDTSTFAGQKTSLRQPSCFTVTPWSATSTWEALATELSAEAPSRENFDHVEWSVFQSAVPAVTLAQQCFAARLLQRAWRRFSCHRFAFKESGTLDRPNQVCDGRTAEKIDDLIDCQYVIEKQVVSALERTVAFKRQSGAPWTVEDEVGLHTVSRQFAAVARRLPHWGLDELGRALMVRYQILSGGQCCKRIMLQCKTCKRHWRSQHFRTMTSPLEMLPFSTWRLGTSRNHRH